MAGAFGGQHTIFLEWLQARMTKAYCCCVGFNFATMIQF